MENKVVEFKFEEGQFVIAIDPNKDGQKMITISINATEVPDEILSMFKKDAPAV